ncbi:unnamed protein product [Schistocephalus solidus]|uniref:Uncharacterized protein n=1 Tax=Schistocephalus solidus TaxID=70667 RepID=A0A3P7D9D8_SCHSO|nr:unnamed protein product [Schistocephalus solidus]
MLWTLRKPARCLWSRSTQGRCASIRQRKSRRIFGGSLDTQLTFRSQMNLPFFSSRGALHPRSKARLRLFGLSKFDLSDLCLMVVRGSLNAYDVYMHGAGGQVNR